MATDIGNSIERQAAQYLEKRGLRLLARQVRYRTGEIDLLMEDNGTLVFVEVRYRRHIAYGDGAESVNGPKRLRIRRAAQLYLAQHPDANARPCRFDVISAGGRIDQPRWDWYRNAFTLN